MAGVDPALVEQVFDGSKRQRETSAEHSCQPDILMAGLEIAKELGLGISRSRAGPAPLTPSRPDTAL